jgi:signal transduction histidine kinase
MIDLASCESHGAGDRVHLTNALTNLVDNALKYGPDGSTIR